MAEAEELYRNFLNGDREAFNDIIRLYHGPLKEFIRYYVTNESDVEDLAADTFVAVLANPNRFRFSCSVKSYLFAIARNLSRTYLRHTRTHTQVELREIVSPLPGPEEQVLFKERFDDLDSLPEQQRTALLLTAVQELSYAEAAAALGVNEAKIRNLCYRARQQLIAKGGKDR